MKPFEKERDPLEKKQFAYHYDGGFGYHCVKFKGKSGTVYSLIMLPPYEFEVGDELSFEDLCGYASLTKTTAFIQENNEKVSSFFRNEVEKRFNREKAAALKVSLPHEIEAISDDGIRDKIFQEMVRANNKWLEKITKHNREVLNGIFENEGKYIFKVTEIWEFSKPVGDYHG